MKMSSALPSTIRCLLFVLVVHLVELVLIVSLWFLLDIQARSVLSVRLGIGTSLLDFNRYIEETFKPGMTRRQIIEDAQFIGPYRVAPVFIGDEYCEIYSFNVGPFQTARGTRIAASRQ